MITKYTRSLLTGILFAAGLLSAVTAQASYVNEAEPNDSMVSAQNLQVYFSTDYDANITNSTTMAHASVNATGNDTWDYYAFTLSALSRVIFDIDNSSAFDSWLNLYDANGNLLAQGDDNIPPDPGSNTVLDSYLIKNLGAGLYFVAVGSYYNSPVFNGARYTLHVSADSPAAVPLPAAASLMLSGLALVGGLVRRRNQKPRLAGSSR